MKKQFFDRCSVKSLIDGSTDSAGRVFLTPGQPVDLSAVRILHTGVDTLRQLYQGTLRDSLVSEISGYLFKGRDPVMTFCGRPWVVGSGGKSGYRYRLQSNEYGLILFVGSRYARMDKEGAHLKIECSPHFLKDQSSAVVQGVLDEIASLLLDDPVPTGVALHIAIDVQGWSPPRDFEYLLTTRSKRLAVHSGLESIELSGGETVQRYGRGESYLFGLPTSCQFSVYRKDLEAVKRDKLDWWRSVWSQLGDELGEPFYDQDKPVWRLEWRFHHSVVQQVQRSENVGFRTYAEVSPVLTNLLHYGMDLFRLDYGRSFVDPFWQLLYQDVKVLGEVDTFVVRRVYKTPGLGDERNLAMAFGNMMSLYARYHYKASVVIKHLKGAKLWKELCIYWGQRGIDPQEAVQRALDLRRLVGRAA